MLTSLDIRISPYHSFSDAPPETDSDVEIRERICEEIINAGTFYAMDNIPANLDEMYLSRDIHPNEYRQREFRLTISPTESYQFTEFVFPCPVKSMTLNPSRGFFFYYISKEYNLSLIHI